MERKWVVAAFLDITGFRSWTYRAATAPEMKEAFIGKFYAVLQNYVKDHLDVWSKYEGDGILLIREFTPEERKGWRPLQDFILGLRCLYRKANKVIRNSESSPDGVRIRIISGYVYRLSVIDPNDPERKRMIPEYLEYCTNTVRGLLEVNPEIPCLVTKGLLKDSGKRRSVLRVRPLGKPSSYPKGINMEDVNGLEVLKF